MALNSITGLVAHPALQVPGLQTPGIQGPGNSVSPGKSSAALRSDVPFADLVKGMIHDTNQQQLAVEDSVKKMVAGETDSIHDVVLTASRADLAFRLVMEIRNRLIASYQEIMRMQV